MRHQQNLQTVVLAAGESTRMGKHQKVVQNILGKPVLSYVLNAGETVSNRSTHVVVGHRSEEVKNQFSNRDIHWVYQEERLGTGHALLQARPDIDKDVKNVLVLLGDAPGIRPETVRKLVDQHQNSSAKLTVLTADLQDPAGYGRILRNDDQTVSGIVEEDEATRRQKEIREVNSGVMILETEPCLNLLEELPVHEKSGEIYLTDLIALLAERNEDVRAVKAETEEEIYGINTPEQKAKVSDVLRKRILYRHMKNGVEIRSPEQTYIEPEATIGEGTVIEPFVVIRGDVEIGKNCHVGPFSQLRKGTELKNQAEIGNFVETKKTRVGAGSKAKHLAYLGDAELGENVNIGAGTITANYDGENKHTTTFENGSSTGSNSVLVAPVQMKKGSRTGAGAVVLNDVEEGDTVVGVPANTVSKNEESDN